MIFSRIRQVLDKLSLQALGNRLNKRTLQAEIDTHKLFLLTSHYADRQRGTASEPDYVEKLAAEAARLDHEERQKVVANNVRGQLLQICRTLHYALEEAGDPVAPAQHFIRLQAEGIKLAQEAQMQQQRSSQRTRGLAGAIRITQPSPGGPAGNSDCDGAKGESIASGSGATEGPSTSGQDLSTQDVAALFRERHGFSLRVAQSTISHSQAGDGVFLDGRALPGAVVALYPGVVYTPLHHRHMPNYPRVDQGNDYLISRFDGAILDALPWGLGGECEPSSRKAGQQRWHTQLERRHPLALAHFANHPPAGTPPNVALAPFDFCLRSGEEPWLRVYFPNVMFGTEHRSVAEVYLTAAERPVLGLAFVATRLVEHEELLLNYRLSTHVPRPDWYMPVDAEEDKRRWA